MHTDAWMHMYVKHDKHGFLHVGSHLQILYMCDGLGYLPLSRLVARQWSSSCTGLDTDVTHRPTYFFHIANGSPQGSHLKVPSNGASAPVQAPRMCALPKLSIKVVHTVTQGSLFG